MRNKIGWKFQRIRNLRLEFTTEQYFSWKKSVFWKIKNNFTPYRNNPVSSVINGIRKRNFQETCRFQRYSQTPTKYWLISDTKHLNFDLQIYFYAFSSISKVTNLSGSVTSGIYQSVWILVEVSRKSTKHAQHHCFLKTFLWKNY